MTIENKDWERLNAYIDGELPAKDIPAFEQLLALSPELEQERQRLLSLKTRLEKLKPTIDGIKAAEDIPLQSALQKNLIAATLLAAIIGITAYLWSSNFLGGPRTPLALHGELSAKAYILKDAPSPLLVSKGPYTLLSIPDLTPSALTLVDVMTTELGETEAVALHYRGQRGCRLTFVAVQRKTKAVSLLAPKIKNILREQWVQKGTHFYLFASGMDEKRFAAIASYARNQQKILRTAMQETYKTARPCA